MEVNVSQQIRSAIKAKLHEIGEHFDDELPDYIMVLIANRRTKHQMENELDLFLGENTIKFVTWLHHVLKKLEQVKVANKVTPAQSSSAKSSDVQKKKTEKESKKSSSESKVQFKLKNNLVNKTEYDKKKEKQAESKEKKSTKKDDSKEAAAISPAKSQHDSHMLDLSHEDILILGDEWNDLDGEPANKAKVSKLDIDKLEEDEDLLKLKAFALQTKSTKKQDDLSFDDILSPEPLPPNKEENTKKRKSSSTKVKALNSSLTLYDSSSPHSGTEDANSKIKDSSSRQLSPPPPRKRLRSVVTTIPPKQPPAYDPTQPNLYKLSSVVSVPASSQPQRERPKRTLNSSLILKAVKDAEKDKSKESIQSSKNSNHVQQHRNEGEEMDRRVIRIQDRKLPESRRTFHHSTRDNHESMIVTVQHTASQRQSLSPSPPPVNQKKGLSIRDRLGEWLISKHHTTRIRDEELDMDYMNEDELKAMESDLNIIINIPNIRNETHESKSKQEQAEIDNVKLESQEIKPLQDDDCRKKLKGYVAPDKLSIRVMNSSDDSGGESTCEKEESQEKANTLDPVESEEILPSSAESEKMNENTAQTEQISTPASASSDPLADLRAKLATIQEIDHAIQDSAVTLSKTPFFMSSMTSSAPTACKFWPSCSFGDKCKFTHPKCKYGDLCGKRPNCPYHHNNTIHPPAVSSKQNISSNYGNSSKLCLFFPNCTSMDCIYYHPKPCRYGIGCTDPNCIHYHPRKGNLPNINQLKWTKQKTLESK